MTRHRTVLAVSRMLFLFAGAAPLAACGTNLKPHIERMEGCAVEVVTAGTGGPSVVFEAGFGNDWAPWDRVASEVALHARVFAYSRPGYGASDPTSTPRDAGHIVEELRALLRAGGHAPPYLLVGHSFGGTYMELFARLHPEEVSGLVLVDPRHADFSTACAEAHIDGCGIPDGAVKSLSRVEQDEYHQFPLTSGAIRAAGPFGSYPVRVLTATSHGLSQAGETLWVSMLASLASEAPDGRQVLFPGADHNLEHNHATEVAQAILALAAAAHD